MGTYRPLKVGGGGADRSGGQRASTHVVDSDGGLGPPPSAIGVEHDAVECDCRCGWVAVVLVEGVACLLALLAQAGRWKGVRLILCGRSGGG